MQFEYKTVAINVEKSGWLNKAAKDDSIDEIDRLLKALGQDGWELVAVLPITNGGSPAQINQGIHYFKRPLLERES
jgi:hypothetical protein